MLVFTYTDLKAGKVVFQCKAAKGTLLTEVDKLYVEETGHDPVKQSWVVVSWKEEL